MPHDREGLFNEARQPKRPVSIDSRRSSTTVDDNGCIIIRGFEVPSRSSSQSSLTRSTTSSFDTPSTPLSPMEPASPGFAPPIAADAALRTSSSLTSLVRSIQAAGSSMRPFPDRRQTWQVGSAASVSSSRWDDDDLATVNCRAQTGHSSNGTRPAVAVAPPKQRQIRPQPSKKYPNFRRIKSEQANLQKLATRDSGRIWSKSTYSKRGALAADETVVTLVGPEQADDAIASESEDDDVVCNRGPLRDANIRRNRLDYATRRAMADDRNATLLQQARQAASPAELYSTISTPVPDTSNAQEDLDKVSQKLELVSASLSDNAIASDSEDDDYTCKGDPTTTAALRQAAIHRERNVAIAHDGSHDEWSQQPQKRSLSDAAVSVLAVEPSGTSPHKRNFSVSSLTVKLIAPKRTAMNSDNVEDLETPVQVKTYDTGSALSIRSLRPSKTRPKPAKGVLKKSGSPSSTGVSSGVSTAECSPSKKVQTRVRSGSVEIVDGIVRLKSPPQMTDDGVFRPGQVAASEMRRLAESADILK